MNHDDFDSVSWRNDPESDVSRPTTSETDAEPEFDYGFQSTTRGDTNGKRRVSLSRGDGGGGDDGDELEGEGEDEQLDPTAGILEGVLECSVDTPMKENDGTKDAYVSYLVTTHVGGLIPSYVWSR